MNYIIGRAIGAALVGFIFAIILPSKFFPFSSSSELNEDKSEKPSPYSDSSSNGKKRSSETNIVTHKKTDHWDADTEENTETLSTLSDETYYLTATQEVDNENRVEALWAKSMALSEGNEDKARYKYILLRVEQFRAKSPVDAISSSVTPKDSDIPTKIESDFSTRNTPIQQFSKLKDMPAETLRTMIRNGDLRELVIYGQWYVRREEVKRDFGS
jgi:cytoskeletal protein RodZ